MAIALTVATSELAPQPLPRPRFLPPSASSPSFRTKKDPLPATTAALRESVCTLHNVHTGEALALDPVAAPGETARVCRLLRDRTTWEEHAIDTANLATVRIASAALGSRRVEVISGYRSDKLNEMLRKKGRHVARSSQHVLGRALDFRVAGVATPVLLRTVRAVHVGGVGFYPSSGFVHVDTGRARRWGGD